MKIGILGGTFNPIHYGHLLIAQNALDQFHLDKIWFMPAAIPPHKQGADILDARNRMQMILRAIEGNCSFEMNPRELLKGGVSYTYETLQELTKECPENEYYFIIGADSLLKFHTWRHPEIILQHATVLVAVRDHVAGAEIESVIKKLTAELGGNIMQIYTPEFDVSSHEIRQRVDMNHSIRYLLPDSVCDYIIQENLYKD